MRRLAIRLALYFTSVLTPALALAEPKTFYMDEGTHYSDISMCKNQDLNTAARVILDETMKALASDKA
jgi:hypothetical protein